MNSAVPQGAKTTFPSAASSPPRPAFSPVVFKKPKSWAFFQCIRGSSVSRSIEYREGTFRKRPSALPTTFNSSGCCLDWLDSFSNYSMISRPEVGSTGHHISLLVNHFTVAVKSPDEIFYQYSVKLTFGDDITVESKAVGRKVIGRLYQTYSSELSGKQLIYDGGKILYTVGPLPRSTFEFTVMLEESCAKSCGSPREHVKKSKHSSQSKVFKVVISYSTKIPLQSIALAPKESKVDEIQDALRVLDVLLRHQSANKGFLVVRQSFFKDDSRNLIDVGGGVTGLRGFHSSFRMIQAGLSLNMDAATTIVLSPGPILDFLLANQNVREPRYIDWAKAKRMLKNLRIKTRHTNREYKISGLSEKPCYQQSFPMRIRNEGNSKAERTVETTVFDYFTKQRGFELSYSKYTPCLDVGKPKCPNYLPMELCSLVPLQRYTKALSPMQSASLVEKSRQKPQEQIKVLTDTLRDCQYDNEPLLAACGILIEKQFMQVGGRILEAPKLKVGKGEDCIPRNGRWNFNNKQFISPVKIERWAIVNFSSRCDTSHLSRELINCGRNKGVHIERPYALIEEDQRMKKATPLVRVDEMFEKLQDKLPGEPEFILCVLPERKNSDLYGPWKMRSLCKFGVVTQCVSPIKITDQYLTNVLLKINAKLGGTNSMLAVEQASCIPLIKDTPTMILGMDVSHGSPGESDIPSIVAVVGSLSWPHISRYRAAVRSQSPKVEMIECLFKPLENGEDDGIMRELLYNFYTTSKAQKPRQIIIFRDGVSESQFHQVLNIELEQIKQAYLGLGELDLPKFTVIVAQKNHHTKLFQTGSPENVPPGTIVDTEIVHPRNYDFYLCSHAGLFGTVRPTHYHVLLDEIGFSADELQNFINSLCYVYQRSTCAVSVVAPISYAHLAAKQVGQFIKFEELSETACVHEGITTAESVPVPELPRLVKRGTDCGAHGFWGKCRKDFGLVSCHRLNYHTTVLYIPWMVKYCPFYKGVMRSFEWDVEILAAFSSLFTVEGPYAVEPNDLKRVADSNVTVVEEDTANCLGTEHARWAAIAAAA
ncbi:hypothetical protein Nepgr_000558 [Nepenthes gracilis]|uniref:Uncharacterized protein n=1 Tax=Nepenthes gracilis TaxID=150966 RepID=A0AAD3P6L5_NEPGR|nr:hypothetical protein Nepgr_000558 [Nepenthes gracilis]